MTKKNLIDLCLQHDRDAQKELVYQYAPALLTVSRRYIPDYHYAEDNLQDSFIVIFNHLDQYDEQKASLYTWMRKIVINQALKKLKHEKAKLNGASVLEEESAGNIIYDDRHFLFMDAEYLLQIIQNLEEPYRTIFNLFAIDGYTHEEISSMLNIAIATSRSYVFRARKQLMQSVSAQNELSYGK